ncbi:MAG: hypothetical protein FWD74_07460 [Actinomycetia bacterium]|nr:hypothetical protein [Actinomycetes bacterium]
MFACAVVSASLAVTALIRPPRASSADGANRLFGSMTFTKTTTGISLRGHAYVANKAFCGIYVQLFLDDAYPNKGAKETALIPAYPAQFAKTWTAGSHFSYGEHTITAVALNPYDASRTVIGKSARFSFNDPKYKWGKVTSFSVTDPGWVRWSGWAPAGMRVQYLIDGRVKETLGALSRPRQFERTWILGRSFAAGAHVFQIRAVERSGKTHVLYTSKRMSFSRASQAVAAAVYRLPGHGKVAGKDMVAHATTSGAQGTTNLMNCQVWINVPRSAGVLDDVVRHEYMHVLQCRLYQGQIKAMEADAGPSPNPSVRSLDFIADAGVRLLGGKYTYYLAVARAGKAPTCRERRQAANLLNGHKMRFQGALAKHNVAWC